MALSTYQLSDDGDLILSKTLLPTRITGDNAILQLVKQHLKTWTGGYLSDPTWGTDWVSILGNKLNREAINQTFTKSLLQLDFVQSVVDVFVKLNSDRQAELTYIIIVDDTEFTGVEVI